MYNVVKQIKRSIAVFTALIFTLISTKVRAGSYKSCGPEELAQCAKSLSILTDSGLSFVRNKEQLDSVCPDLFESLYCIHGYSRLCMNLHQRQHFRKLFDGTGDMIRNLCHNETYQEEFLSYAPCMNKVADETEMCFSKYSAAMTEIQAATNKQQELEEEAKRNQHHHHHHHRFMQHHQQQQQQQQHKEQQQPQQNKTEKSDEQQNMYKFQKAKREAADESLKGVCCSFQEYVDCSTNAIRRTCGEDAAIFTRNFLDKMASSLIKMHCMNYSVQDCKARGFNVAGFYLEGYYYSKASWSTSSWGLMYLLPVLLVAARYLR